MFLKIEAFRMDAMMSIISFLDIVVTNVENLATRIGDLLPGGRCTQEMIFGSAAVMQRVNSKITFNGLPQKITKSDWKKNAAKPRRGRTNNQCTSCTKKRRQRQRY